MCRADPAWEWHIPVNVLLRAGLLSLALSAALLGCGEKEENIRPVDPAATVPAQPAPPTITTPRRGDAPAPLEAGPRVRTGGEPGGVSAGEGSVWVATGTRLSRVNPRRARVTGDVPVESGTFHVAAGGGAVWAATESTGSLVQVDAREAKVVKTIEVGSEPRSVAADDDGVWVTSFGDSRVTRVNPETGDVVRAVSVEQPVGVAVGEDAVWVASQGGRSVARIDPGSNTVAARISVELDDEEDTGPAEVAAGEGAVWVTHPDAGVVTRIDPATNRVTAHIRLRLGGQPVDVATGDGGVWVAAGSYLIELDPESGRAVSAARARGSFSAVTAGEGGIWAADSEARGVAAFEPG
jgi:streptogramin lyase